MKQNKILKILSAVAVLFFLNSCSQSRDDKYIGYWIEDGKEHSEVLEIKKEGDKLYLNSKDLEAPATYNKEDKTLKTQITNGVASVDILMNLLDNPDKMKMSIANKGAEFSRVSKEKAEEYKKAYDDYYNPEFFVGEWKSDVKQEKPLKIIKEGDSYFYIDGFLGKRKLAYDNKKHLLIGNIGITTITIHRSGENEITAYGKKYQKV
ncbi:MULTISPECIES: hypothetical protein [Sphingobacterium]|uniref:hypothetical protein n=1 Tax=Sphingobacterium TaxID=28453 RepID=UPI00257ED361|nr:MULTISPECIES: hypothetical protein [Sphingobacterium]